MTVCSGIIWPVYSRQGSRCLWIQRLLSIQILNRTQWTLSPTHHGGRWIFVCKVGYGVEFLIRECNTNYFADSEFEYSFEVRLDSWAWTIILSCSLSVCRTQNPTTFRFKSLGLVSRHYVRVFAEYRSTKKYKLFMAKVYTSQSKAVRKTGQVSNFNHSFHFVFNGFYWITGQKIINK